MGKTTITYTGTNGEEIAEFVGPENYKEDTPGFPEIFLVPRWMRLYAGDVISKETGQLSGMALGIQRDSLMFS